MQFGHLNSLETKLYQQNENIHNVLFNTSYIKENLELS
jgi:hypothetical protein